MVCYAVPIVALFASFFGQKAKKIKSIHGHWLNLMFLGASVFGGIDHFWNGELFLIKSNWVFDIALGVTITLGTLGAWGLIVHKQKIEDIFSLLQNKAGIHNLK